MKLKKTFSIFYAAVLTAIFFGLTSHAYAQFSVLYNFAGGGDGVDPTAGVVLDSAGNIYGTTFSGGCWHPVGGCGTVFELSPSGSGWTHTVLARFDGGAKGGSLVSGLVRDAAGNLYGTTEVGGDNTVCATVDYPLEGCGVVFKLSHDAAGQWKETVIHTFTGGADGAIPMSDLIIDAAGNLYGTTWFGGGLGSCRPIGCGVAFRLSQTSTGWHETVLYNFHAVYDYYPLPSGLVMDASGNLYGTTYEAVFELSPTASGPWTETTLSGLIGAQYGASTPSSLTLDAAGNLYGTTEMSGANNLGTVFELSPGTGGSWTETVLHSFDGTDGEYPRSGVLFDPAGNLYGSTYFGIDTYDCPPLGCGAIYELSPGAGGWTLTVLHSFNGDGGHPSELVRDASGTLYGTANSVNGLVFSQSTP
jgi:uncharacterized repeat protein (TIGR03803 family)